MDAAGAAIEHDALVVVLLDEREPARFVRRRVNFRMNSASLRPRNSAMGAISFSSILTSPGHLQQFPQRWQT
jgi:hypothetical protein